MQDDTVQYPICWAVEVTGNGPYDVNLFFSQIQNMEYMDEEIPSLPNPKLQPITQWRRAPDLTNYDIYRKSGALPTMNLLTRIAVGIKQQ